jgi:hypothetical protein
VPRQCRHGRPRRHPLLQEVQRTCTSKIKQPKPADICFLILTSLI